MNRFGKIFLSIMFLILIFSFSFLHVIIPDSDVSDTENRTLADKPALNLDSILTGSFMSEFEAYFTDHFPARDRWLKYYVDYQLLTNQSTINDIYVTDDNWLLPVDQSNHQKKDIDETISKLAEFSLFLKDRGIEYYYFILPHKAAVLDFLYPDYIDSEGSKRGIAYFESQLNRNQITAVNMVEQFEERFNKEDLSKLYFKTDHHWNMQGAFEGYKIIVNSLKQHSKVYESDGSELLEENYNLECISPSRSFVGSYNRQLYLRVSSDSDDKTMCMMNHPLFSTYQVAVDGEDVETFKLYGSGVKKQTSDSYTYGNLFTRDHARIKIINPERKDVGNLLVIKNSYANPLTYHFAQHFYQTVIYDPRHNKGMTLKEYIEQNDFDVIIQMYNSTILSGPNFNWK